MEEDDVPGLLVLLDFEKAFDTVEWSFLYKILQFFGFGESFCSWIKTFYNDISKHSEKRDSTCNNFSND
jgi:hypothetical protein